VPDVVLVGAFGQRNPGDEALLHAFLGALPPGNVTIASSDPAGTRAAFGRDTVASHRALDVAAAVRRADAVVVGGGTVFKTLHPAARRDPHELLRNSLLLAHATRALGKQLVMVGVGAGALASRRAQRLSRRLVPRADLLVLRDEESAAVLTSIGAPAPFRVGADASWALLDAPLVDDRDHPPRIRDEVIIALSGLAGGPDLADVLAEHIRALRARRIAVTLQPWQLDGDLSLARAVAGRVGPDLPIIDAPVDLADARHQYRGARLVIGMRFHALVAAAAAAVPFIAVDHELKLGALARRFEQPIVSLRTAPERFASSVVDALDAAHTPPASVVQRQIALAEESFRLLRLVLEHGESADPDALAGLPLEPAPWEVPA
jgi:polysaccharide pyruvyl transferase WcaK-like protein